jgi:hypothetical protein
VLHTLNRSGFYVRWLAAQGQGWRLGPRAGIRAAQADRRARNSRVIGSWDTKASCTTWSVFDRFGRSI